MKIALTGARGFVGGHLTAQLRAAGHDVVALACRLESEATPEMPEGLDALIHAACDFSAEDDRNVTGSLRIFEAAKKAGVNRLIFVSSLSAFEGCKSRYGASKLIVEKYVAAIGGCSVRLGFVCDDTSRGLSGSLKKLAALPIVPLPGGGHQNLFTIRAEDLGAAFLEILREHRGEVVNLAHPEPVSLARMMRTFAKQQGKRGIFLPFPWRLLWAPLRAAEAIGIRLPFRSDSLVSLMNQNPAPDFTRLRDLKLNLQAF
jgi:nucleoside-diphosphate-sugar epimerase